MEGRGGGFVMEPSEAESLAKECGASGATEALPWFVKRAKGLARTPISNFQVGAVAVGSSGRVFFGVNLEFRGLPLHHAVHAEQFLVVNLILHAEPALRHLAVSSAPCGHCRQFLQEIRHSQEIRLHALDQNAAGSLADFLPHRFGPNDLLDMRAPLLLEPRHNALALAAELPEGLLCNGGPGADPSVRLRSAALDAANRSHAPYSRCPSGVALMDSDGEIYSGSYLESAAYNPSLGPVQAAIVAFVAGSGGRGYDCIVAAVLVEKEDALVVQQHTASLILQTIAPKCDFKVFHCISEKKAAE